MDIDEIVESSSNFPYKVVDRCVVGVDLEEGNKDMVLCFAQLFLRVLCFIFSRTRLYRTILLMYRIQADTYCELAATDAKFILTGIPEVLCSIFSRTGDRIRVSELYRSRIEFRLIRIGNQPLRMQISFSPVYRPISDSAHQFFGMNRLTDHADLHPHEEAHDHDQHLKRSMSDKTVEASPANMKKSASEKLRVGEDEEGVDAKADDFINRFKQQLKLQRLDSILRRVVATKEKDVAGRQRWGSGEGGHGGRKERGRGGEENRKRWDGLGWTGMGLSEVGNGREEVAGDGGGCRRKKRTEMIARDKGGGYRRRDLQGWASKIKKGSVENMVGAQRRKRRETFLVWGVKVIGGPKEFLRVLFVALLLTHHHISHDPNTYNKKVS
ncbi:hypothetical protein TEA_024960 [Camellia sinensis var. sinensis]|uniref:Uncharacterized protein n=1 Tax=Camellia sinensis var. sinensis TaxID=542762 RepID=A0A4S4EY42_CAMSN|nr:hypothetical protein TEA_024960 [Camellia sinensis var. sinensis]